MITRISGSVAAFVVAFTLSILLMIGVEVFDKVLDEYPPPKLTQLILLLAPVAWAPLVNPVLFAAWYWLLSKQDPPPRRALVWHIFALAFSAILFVVGLTLLTHFTYMGGQGVPVSPGQWMANVVITGGLAFAVWWEWKRQRSR